MQRKDIKVITRKQLKLKFPNWNRLNRKTKKDIARKTLQEVYASYEADQEVQSTPAELFGLEDQVPQPGIITLTGMADKIKKINNSSVLKLSGYKRAPIYINDEELRFVDELLDNTVLDYLMWYEGYSPGQRDVRLYHLFRAELLKAIKYPEISYRKFCTEEYFGLDRTENRVFIGLPLHKKVMIDHTELSNFRRSLTFVQQVNLLVYILHHLYHSGLLGDKVLHGVDSTELANECMRPLATLEIGGKKVRIYNDIDCDSGKRRNKRDKSPFVVGYRLHTLTVIDADTGHSFPLVSVVAAANHHDSNFLPFIVNLAQAIGIDVKLITADEAYHDKDGSLYEDTGVIVTTPPSSKVVPPENTDPETGAVYCHADCTIALQYVGADGNQLEFRCDAAANECQYPGRCPKSRLIPVDSGIFQRIPYHTRFIQDAHDLRKNCERPFNLLKNQTGLEKLRVRSQHATLTRCTLSSIAVLLIKMAGTRRKPTVNKQQLPLFDQKKAA